MSSVTSYVVKYIRRRIPERILKDTFMKDRPFSPTSVANMDSRIINQVIREVVLPDCNQIGGREALIDLTDLRPISIDQDGRVYRIPKNKTMQASIVSVKYAGYQQLTTAQVGSVTGGMVGYTTGGSQVAGLVASVYNSIIPDNITGTVDVSMVEGSDNTVFIKDWGGGQLPYWLLAVVEHDEALNQISPHSYPFFAKQCLYAAQMLIYNKMVIEMDMGKLYGGAELGRFREIIDGYADAADNYDTYLRETMEVVFMLNDPRKKQEHYFMITGGRR